MVRRVKAYLLHLKVCVDEDELRKLSFECEPLQGTGSGTIQRKRQPSPTLSTASSNSSTSAASHEGRKHNHHNQPNSAKFGMYPHIQIFGKLIPRLLKNSECTI